VLSSKVRRAVAGCSLVLASSLVMGAPWAADQASAKTLLPVKAKVKARSHVAKLNSEIKGLKGKFKGTINLDNGKLKGGINLPPTTLAFPSNDAELAQADVELANSKIKGRVNLDNLKVKTTSTFNMLLKRVSPLGLPVNLVGDNCTTATPISVEMKGTFSFDQPGEFVGVYEIPPFANCQGLEAVLTALISGPDNTFTAKFIPIT